MNIVTDSEAVY